MSPSVEAFAARKTRGEPIVVATAYDFPTARLVAEAGLDAILVGDSVGMVVLGYPDTLSVTIDDMAHHTRAARRGAGQTLVITDMPAGSYRTPAEAVGNAQRLVEAGAQAVKLEGGTTVVPVVRAVVEAGIAVHGHVGLTPQQIQSLGGFRVQGKTADSARQILDDALALQAAGCFGVVIECVPAKVAAHITAALAIPTIGIGAGADTSGQVLVLHDLLGLTAGTKLRFVKAYADVNAIAQAALRTFRQEVTSRTFPAAEHTYDMPEAEWQRFLQSSPAGGDSHESRRAQGKS